jgi:hypothetical protein
MMQIQQQASMLVEIARRKDAAERRRLGIEVDDDDFSALGAY